MLLRPDWDDFRLIGFHAARVVTGLGVLMLATAGLAVLRGEWNDATALGVGAGLAVSAGLTGTVRLRSREHLDWSHAMATAAAAWLVAAVFGAVPLFLSGHFGGPLDAYFEAFSGLTGTGLTLVQDLDHLGASMNVWRHLMHLVGGLATVVVALTVFTVGTGQSGTFTVGEARDDRIMPNVPRIARFVSKVIATYGLLGILALTLTTWLGGLPPGRALWHATLLAISAVSTGGFAPTSMSVGFYHSGWVELSLIVLMIAGALSYGLHYQLWRGRRRELFLHLETRTLLGTFLVVTGGAMLGFGRSDAFTDAAMLFRKGFFTMVSAHTTTGLSVVADRLVVTDWGLLAPAAMVGAMAVGGMAGSSTGGIKVLRMGLVAKSIVKDIKTVLLPESALVVETYHAQRRQILRDGPVRAAVSLLLLGLLTNMSGGIVGMLLGFDFTEALFDATAATSNTGFSLGVLSPDAPAVLKLVAIGLMWFGRLEFFAAFTLFGYVIALGRGRT